MEPMYRIGKVKLAIICVLLAGFALMIMFTMRGTGAVNPAADKERKPDSGVLYAALYKSGELYDDIGENDEILRQVENDIMLFARTTRLEFQSQDVLVGFTFKGHRDDGETSIHTGHYYGLKDKIEIRVTPHGRGVYTLSITNLADKTNIDEFLSMNGQRNRFIKELPIESTYYSIRYHVTQDRVLVTFYDNYTAADVQAVEAALQKGLSDNWAEEVTLSRNRFGTATLSDIKASAQ